MSIIYVYGPAASGKTRNAPWIAAHYNCLRILDEWHVGDTRKIQDGDLVLGQDPSLAPKGSTIIHITQAIK